MQRHYFLLKRLHSLTGIVPIGMFLVIHLTTNSSLAWGKVALRGDYPELGVLGGGVAYFQREVTWINTSVPHLALLEWTLWISILFHSVLGFYYAFTARPNTTNYPYLANWRYRLQRWSGYIGILFIFYHVATLRWNWYWLVPPFDGSVQWSHAQAASTLAAALRGGENFTAAGLVVALFYFLGVSLLVFHFANGLWTAAITWGLTVSEKAQRRWGYLCFGLGVGLMAMAWASLGAALLTKPSEARQIEAMIGADGHGGAHGAGAGSVQDGAKPGEPPRKPATVAPGH